MLASFGHPKPTSNLLLDMTSSVVCIVLVLSIGEVAQTDRNRETDRQELSSVRQWAVCHLPHLITERDLVKFYAVCLAVWTITQIQLGSPNLPGKLVFIIIQ